MIELRILRMPLRATFTTSGWYEKEREFILIKYSKFGITGYGEVVASKAPYYSAETVASAWSVLIHYLLPMVVDEPEVESFLRKAKRIRGNRMAKAGVELALYDFKAKLENRPLYDLYGGIGGEIEVGVSVGIKRDYHELRETIRGYLNQGYQRIKLKIRKGWDFEILKRIRREFRSIRLWADANGCYSAEDIDHLRRVDEFGLELLEQPFPPDDLISHAQLRERLKTPICLDESIESVDDLKTALALGAIDILNLKVGRVGGISETLRIIELSQEKNLPVWIGGMLESGIGRAHNLHLASNPIFSLPPDLSASDRYYEEDIIYPPLLLRNGRLSVPDGPGIGLAVREELINRYTIHRETLKGA